MKSLTERKHYKWIIAAISFITVMIALGFCSSAKGLFTNAITGSLNIERGKFEVNNTIRFITTAVLNLFFSFFIVRLKPKKMMVLGLTGLIGSMLAYSFATNLLLIYIGGCLLGFGLSWCTTTMVGFVVSKWFSEGRGTIMGIILAANGLGSAIATQLLSPIIDETAIVLGQTGYAFAYRIIAALLAAVIVLILAFFKEQPAGYTGDGKTTGTKKKRGRVWIGIAWNDMLKKSYFYVTAVCVFLTGMVLQSVAGAATPHLKEVFSGDGNFATNIITMYSLVLCASKVLTGLFYDKFGLRITMLICNMTATLSIFLLSFISSLNPNHTIAVIYELLIPFAMPLETVMLPLIASDMFGEMAYAKVMGLFVSINTAGYALGSPLTGWMYDTFGSYNRIFLAFAIIMAIILIIEQININCASKDRDRILANHMEN